MGIWQFLVELALLLGMTFMRCSSRPSRARETGAGRRLASAVAIIFVLVVVAASSSAQAQTPTPTPTPTPSPSPTPSPTPTSINSDMSAGAAVTNLGSNFLERLWKPGAPGIGGALGDQPR